MVSQGCILCDSNTKHNDVICNSPDSIKSLYYVIKPTLKFLGAGEIPKGILNHRKQPQDVAKVVSLLLSSSKGTC